jgi:probable HAF family extracellular repeat protein
MTDLGTLGGSLSTALGINGTGEVVGHASIPGNYDRAFLWQTGVMTDLGTLGFNSVATGINDQALVAGYFSVDDHNLESHAFLWEDGQMADLNGLVSNGDGWTLNTATAIN